MLTNLPNAYLPHIWENPTLKDRIFIDFLFNSVSLPAEVMDRPNTDVRPWVKIDGIEAARRLREAKKHNFNICGTCDPELLAFAKKALISLRTFSFHDANGEFVEASVLAYKIYTEPTAREIRAARNFGTPTYSQPSHR